jgi:hypothetical protein
VTTVKVAPPWRGLDLSGQYPDDGFGTRALNVLPGRKDTLIPRGAIRSRWNGLVTPPYNTNFGGWVVGDKVFMAGTHNDADEYDVAAGTVTALAGVTVSSADGFSRSFANIDATAVGPRVGTALYRWVPGAAPAVVANSPVSAQAVCSHLTRLFVLGGSTPGTVTPTPNNVLFWTDPAVNSAGATLDSQLAAGALAAWQDDTSGLVNKIALPAGDTYLGLVSVNRALYILGRQTIYALTGSTPSTFTLSKVASTGLQSDGHAYCASDYGFYFLANDGVRYCDGSSVTNLSWPRVHTAFSLFNNQASMALLPGGYLAVCSPPDTWRVLQIATGYWTDFQTNLSPSGGGPAVIRTTQSKWVGLDRLSALAYDLTTTTLPDWTTTIALGLAELGSNSTPFAVDAATEVQLAAPMRAAALRRAHAAQSLTTFNNSATRIRVLSTTDPTPALDANLVGTNNVVFPRQRLDAEARSETDSIQVMWTYVPGTTPKTDASYAWYPTYVEYDPAQAR